MTSSKKTAPAVKGGRAVAASQARAPWRDGGAAEAEESRRNEQADAARVLADARRAHPGDIYGQFEYLMTQFRIPAARGRARPVSSKTTEKYGDTITVFLHTLAELNMLMPNLDELTHKHFRKAIAHWEENNLSASTLANRYSSLARLYRWLSKGENLPTFKDMLKDPARGVRQYSRTLPASWEELGVDVKAAIEEAGRLCPTTGLQLRLEYAFGLRSGEALQIKPHLADGRLRKTNPSNTLKLNRGTKGGRVRYVPIETPEQIEVLEEAKRAANASTGLIGKYGQSYERAKNHYYYILKKVGLTRKGLGVTPHGLRNAYASETHKKITGELSPVNGGGQVDRETELEARLEISERLGHSRPGIAAAYCGTYKNLGTLVRRNLDELLALFRQPKIVETLTAIGANLAKEGLEMRLQVYGREAEGRAVVPGTSLNLCILLSAKQGGPIAEDVYEHHLFAVMRALQKVANEQTKRHCTFVDARSVNPEVETFDLI